MWISDFLAELRKAGTARRFSREHTPQTLLKASSRIFSGNIPWVGRDLTKADWNSGPWRLMDSPLIFLMRNRCILDEGGHPFMFSKVFDIGGETLSFYADEPAGAPAAAPFAEGIPNDPRAEMLFRDSDLIPRLDSPYLGRDNSIDAERLRFFLAPQLGERIADDPFAFFLGKMDDPKEKWRCGLFAALYLHGYSDGTRRDARSILDSMNASMGGSGEFLPERIRFELDPGAFDKPRSRDFIDCVLPHASFANPFMMSMLGYARKRGVVATASFGWVKAFDRTLWYSLSQAGRSVCSAEAAGAWSHWWAEEAMGRRLDDPYLEMAIDGFRNEMIAEGWLMERKEGGR